MKKKEITIIGTILVSSIIFAAGVICGRLTKKTKTIEVSAEDEEDPNQSIDISDEDVDRIALLTMAEADDECELGKRLIVDTILNRVRSNQFPDTIEKVIYEPNQFESVKSGYIEQCYIKDDIRRLVLEELKRQISYDVIFFRTKHYSDYGYPLIQCGTHYFSIYE